MHELMNRLEEMAELLYQEKQNEAYQILNEVLPIMMEHFSGDEHLTASVLQILQNGLNAMEEGDLTLFADIIHHELIAMLSDETRR